MGGNDTAKDLILNAAKKGQHVVTANKALLASALPIIEEAFPKRPSRNYRNTKTGERGQGPTLGYEAAVCGSIPIIRTLQTSLLCDNITSIRGIMNGTTNYILSRMGQDSLSYADALKGAQSVGFAEADPTADVEGHDARNKLVLLTKLAYGVHIPPEKVPCTGITSVTDLDFEIANTLGYTIKLLGISDIIDQEEILLPSSTVATTEALIGNDEEKESKKKKKNTSTQKPVRKRLLDMFVSPALVREDSALGRTDDGLNQVIINSDAIGVSTYYGPGAGRYPTANSVIADMMNIATGTMILPPFPRPSPSALNQRITLGKGNEISRWWYLRAPSEVTAKISGRVWENILDVSTVGRYRGQGYDGFLITDRTAREMKGLVTVANTIAKNLPSSQGNPENLTNPVALFPVDDDFATE